MHIPSWDQRLKDWLWSLRDNRTKQGWLMGGVAVVIILIIAAVVVRGPATEAGDQSTTMTIAAPPSSGMIARAIDGVSTLPEAANRIPVGLMIENLSGVRPQSGLQAANVVYEALAEGGITRFFALYTNYQDSDAVLEAIGPVRSARPYFVQLAEEYGALYGHVGGSPQALAAIDGSSRLIDLSQMYSDSVYYDRADQIAAPHNVFTKTSLLLLALRDKGLNTASGDFTPWSFTTELPESDRPDRQTIDIPYYSSDYAVHYDYDAVTNAYLRSNGGAMHTDALTNHQITVKNVIVQFVATTEVGDGSGRLAIDLVGSGRAIVFRNGAAVEGRWSKTADSARTTFTTESGSPIDLVPGNIWISVVPEDNQVTYQ